MASQMVNNSKTKRNVNFLSFQISVKKVNDTNKFKIPLSHLTSGKISIKRRAN